MKTFTFGVVRCLGALLVSLLLLTLFTLLYNQTGVHIKESTGATDYKWEPRQLKTTCDEGFAFMRMDTNGYNNRGEYRPEKRIDVLLMGSSQVEALHVAQAENLASRLNDYHSEYYTYSIGTSGHTVYHCVNNLKAAYDTYHPEKNIFLVIDEIQMSEVKMKSVIEGTWKRIPSYDSGMAYHVQKAIPTVKALYKKVEDWQKNEKRAKRRKVKTNIPPSNDSQICTEEYERVLHCFLAKALEGLDGEKACRLIIIYQPPTRIDRDGNWVNPVSASRRECFARNCEKLGIEFVDMTSPFEELYRQERILAHGFANTAIGVGHLNTHGYRIMAEELASFLK